MTTSPDGPGPGCSVATALISSVAFLLFLTGSAMALGGSVPPGNHLVFLGNLLAVPSLLLSLLVAGRIGLTRGLRWALLLALAVPVLTFAAFALDVFDENWFTA